MEVVRTAARIDDNHAAIVKALRAVGASVQSLAAIGKGCPDLLIGHRGLNYVFEIKDGKKPPSKCKLTPDEIAWMNKWRGKFHVVYSVDDALSILDVK